jgi:tetratricopeptide (TPR) repeat protein
MRYLFLPICVLLAAPAASAVTAQPDGPLAVPSDRLNERKATKTVSPGASYASTGLAYQKSKQYKLSEQYLRSALEGEPGNSLYYYYLANTYVHLRQHDRAIDCYRRSYELDPFSTVSGFCRQALLTYNVSVPVVEKPLPKPKQLPSYKEGSPQNKPWQNSSESVKSKFAPAKVGAESEAKSRDHSAKEQHVNSASAMIRRQAAEEKARKKQFADHLATNVISTGAAKANKIKADAEEQIKELYEGPILYDSQGNPRGRGVPAWHLNPVLQDQLKERASQIRSEAEARAQLELSESNDKSNQYQKWYSAREEDIDYVSDSLESQMRASSARSGVLLNPVGTGLYVRNYSTLKPKHPIPEAHSSVVRMIDRGYVDSEAKRELKEPDQ